MAPEIAALEAEIDATELDARTLVAGLTEADGAWRPAPGAWSVAECLDHLATANRVYVDAMRPSAVRARERGRLRRRPALPGVIGRWFVGVLEPPVKSRMKAPGKIVPRTAPPLADAFAAFLDSQAQARAFLREFADIDLHGVRFVNPFVPGLRFSLATGLHVMPAHERRHLWQAWRVRRALPSSTAR